MSVSENGRVPYDEDVDLSKTIALQDFSSYLGSVEVPGRVLKG